MPKTSCEILFRYVFAFARKLLLFATVTKRNLVKTPILWGWVGGEGVTELTGGVNQTQRGGGGEGGWAFLLCVDLNIEICPPVMAMPHSSSGWNLIQIFRQHNSCSYLGMVSSVGGHIFSFEWMLGWLGAWLLLVLLKVRLGWEKQVEI